MPSHFNFLFRHIIHAILFGFGTAGSPPLLPSGAPFVSLAGLRVCLFRVLPMGCERSLKKPSGGVADSEDMFWGFV